MEEAVLEGLLPTDCRLIPYDTLLQMFTDTVPPGIVTLRPRAAEQAILVIEDDPDTLHAIAEYVETLFPDMRIVRSATCEEALKLTSILHPAVILLDLRFSASPMQGFEFVERLRTSINRGAAVPIVAVTGDNRPDTEARAEAMNFTAFLKKPQDLDQLESVLRRVIGA
jgi:CheY-like chemotaxis protein